MVNEMREKYGNSNGACNENVPSEENVKETAKRTRDNLDSSASSSASPEQKVLKNNDDKKEKPTGKNGKNNSGGKKVENGSNV
jgi:hypothetical protein